MKYYSIKNKDIGLGDYGSALLSGIIDIDDDDNLEILRTGVEVPPICETGAIFIVINDSFKQSLEKNNFSGFTVKKLKKRKIVDVNWIEWIGKDEPEFYPENGEPEGYFEELPHSNELDNQIGELWLLEFKSDGIQEENDNFIEHSNLDFCQPKNRYTKIISEKVKDWMIKNEFDKWIIMNEIS